MDLLTDDTGVRKCLCFGLRSCSFPTNSCRLFNTRSNSTDLGVVIEDRTHFWNKDLAHLKAPVTEQVFTGSSKVTVGHWAKSPSGPVTYPVHTWVVRTDIDNRLIRAGAGSRQVLTGIGSFPKSHLPVLDPIPTVAGGDSWCLAIIISQCWFGGVLNYPVHPKWTVWMRTRRNCAVREESRQCCHHIKFPSLGSLLLISLVSRVFLFWRMLLSRPDARLTCTVVSLIICPAICLLVWFAFVSLN